MTKKIIGAVVAVLAVVGGFMWWNHEQEEKKAGEELAKKALENTPDISTFATSEFKNGEYNATVKYLTPDGPEDFAVNLEIADGKIVNAQATNMAKDGKSKNFQNKFISGFSSQVIGQDLKTLNLKTVSGASLTTGGFNEALQQIRNQAKI